MRLRMGCSSNAALLKLTTLSSPPPLCERPPTTRCRWLLCNKHTDYMMLDFGHMQSLRSMIVHRPSTSPAVPWRKNRRFLVNLKLHYLPNSRFPEHVYPPIFAPTSSRILFFWYLGQSITVYLAEREVRKIRSRPAFFGSSRWCYRYIKMRPCHELSSWRTPTTTHDSWRIQKRNLY